MRSNSYFRRWACLSVSLGIVSGVAVAESNPTPALTPAKAEVEKEKSPVATKKTPVVTKKEEGKPNPKAAEKPVEGSTFVVKTAPFSKTVKVSGIIEGTRATPVEMNLKRWTDMTVVRAVDYGTVVKVGDVLIELETKEIKKKIHDMKLEMPGKKLDFSTAELELANLEKSTPISLEKALRNKMQAEQDLVYFEDKNRPMREREAMEDVKEVIDSLAYAEEELKQLKKMYEQDDLTEETEEIILKRSENTVARYQWLLEQSKARSQRTLETTIPREHETLKTNLELQQIHWRAGEKSLREGLEKKRLEIEAKRRELEDLQLSLIELEEDLVAMKITAPHDGIVYYGMNQRGKWTTASLVERKLIPGGKLAMREITMTVVDPSKVQVRLSLTEAQLDGLAEGQSGPLTLKWKPGFPFEVKVQSIDYVPFPDSTFNGILAVNSPKEAPKMMPGMTASAEILVARKEAALAVPKSSVKEENGKKSVEKADGTKISVKTGLVSGDQIEILEGLQAGDVIRLPSDKSSSSPEKSVTTDAAKKE